MDTRHALSTTWPAPAHRPPRIPFDDLPDDALIRQPTVLALLGITRSTLWRYVGTGRVPPPVLRGRGDGVTAWRVGDIRAHLRALAERRDTGPRP